MAIHFYKYEGAGNDFIIFDNISSENAPFSHNPTHITQLCHRRLGIGADGVIFLEKHPSYDFEMVYYNSDASQSFCGNGSRCAVHLARALGIIQDTSQFLAIDGLHQAHIQHNTIQVSLNNVAQIERLEEAYFLNNGSPHYVCLVEDLQKVDILTLGKAINSSEPFQNTGTNVNFVQLEKKNKVSMRTYERGVNNETLSCGTGAVAAALVASKKGYMSPVCIKTRGGELEVNFRASITGFTEISLMGPARQVFQGHLSI